MSYKDVISQHLSMEGDDDGESVKKASNPGHVDAGTVEIDLTDYEDDSNSLNRMLAVVSKRGSLLTGMSNEDSINLSQNTHMKQNIKLMGKMDQIDGADNLITNGEYLPDLIAQARVDAPVKVINPRSVLTGLDPEVIYYVTNDPNNAVYNHFKSEKMYVAKEPTELAHVIEVYRNQHLKNR